jgi:transcriptional regulator with XRE-family HTH domain
MDQEQAKRLGEFLRQKRKSVGLSTTRLASLIGINDGTITRIEQGSFTAPAPDKLARIAEALGLSLADVYAMAEYAVPADLPSFQPYLRRKYRDMPPEAVEDLDKAFQEIIDKHGYDPDGPHDGEDELPDIDSTI